MQRIAELTAYLQNNEVSNALKASLLIEQGDLYQAIGKLDEALRILKKELLPVFEHLGDLSNQAGTFFRIATICQIQGKLDEALQYLKKKILPIYERLGDIRSRAVTQGKIADILEARGELDEALQICREEELPVFERLGDAREIVITQVKIAILLMQIEPPCHTEANQLLCQALHSAQQMRIPEAKQIKSILEHFKMKC